MAESYSCNGDWVHFSNGACQDLQLTWARIADQLVDVDVDVMTKLSKSLKERSEYATGVAAVGIDSEYLDAPFDQENVKKAWAKVMKTLMDDIYTHGPLSEDMDVTWNEELRLSWLKRLAKMYNCLIQQIET
ncbi:MAG: hypothetical protein OEZ58_13635 [Gammaproteobacteria bacterium]|nr:hypothetical protein [Gammaproteobacteria bacterium]